MAISLCAVLVLPLVAHLGVGDGPTDPRPNAVGDLILTEIRDGPAGQVYVEIANRAGSNVDSSNFALVIDGQVQNLGGLGMIQNGRYRTIGDSAADDLALAMPLDPQGAVIELWEFTAVVDRVGTGQRGEAPDPLPGATASRHFDGAEYTTAWSMDATPTWRAENDGPGVDSTTGLVINEVVYDAAAPSGRFIELYYRGSGTLPLTGHILRGNSQFNLLTFVTLSTANRHHLLWNDDAPGLALLFDQLLVGGDNLYLYGPSGDLLDQVGWTTSQPVGTSVCRIPDGQGRLDGYDDSTSVNAGWQFGCAPSPEWVSLETAQAQYLLPGDTVTYSMAATNRQAASTTIDLTFAAPPTGWTVGLFDVAMIPLVDSDASGAPDISLGPFGSGTQTRSFWVTVTAPPPPPTQDRYVLTLSGAATQGPSDSVDLDTRLYPAVELQRSADPDVIYVQGTGWQEQTTLTLTVRGRGVALESAGSDAADVMFVVDDTGSMGGAINALKDDIQNVTDRLQENVSSLRMGLVSFGDVAEIQVDIDLTYDIDAFRAAVDALFASGGGDGPEDGDIALEIAANLSWRPGNVTRGMVHITDAPTHDDPHLPDVARWAWQTKAIHTNTVAVGAIFFYPPDIVVCFIDPMVEFWLQAAAENGTGTYERWFPPHPLPTYPQVCPQSSMGDLILDGLMGILPSFDTAATDPDITDPDPMVRDVLPSYIGIVPGTFRDPATGSPRPPDFQGTDVNGNTVLEWNVSEVKVGTAWEVAFEATSSLVGLVPTNVFGLSRVSYENWSGSSQVALFPEVSVTVLAPATLPPRNVTTHWDGGTTISLTWEEPVLPVDHYLIYKVGGDPRAFTDLTSGAAYASVPAPATSWTDPAPLTGSGESYYLMRSSDLSGGDVSETTNTAGVFAVALGPGRVALSRPLEYFPWIDYSGAQVDFLAEHSSAFGAASAEYLDAAGAWRSVPGNPDVRVDLGEAFVLDVSGPGGLAVFTGLPGAMVRYDEGVFGGYDLPGARGLSAAVAGDDVVLTFGGVPGLSGGTYEVWASRTRTGFYDGSAVLLSSMSPATFPATAVHAGALASGPEWYYLVVPVDPVLGAGASTFSVGVWSRTYLAKDTFALPLRTAAVGALSSYADAIPEALGLLQLLPNGAWIPHFAEMPTGTYDAAIPLGTGFQIDVRSLVRFAHVGW